MNYMLDTNIITAILKGNEKVIKKLQKLKIKENNIFINAISYYEIKRGLLARDATKQLDKFSLMCEIFDIIFPDSLQIFNKSAEIHATLRQTGQCVEDADIFIASIAISAGSILVTADTDFDKIKEINTENWL